MSPVAYGNARLQLLDDSGACRLDRTSKYKAIDPSRACSYQEEILDWHRLVELWK